MSSRAASYVVVLLALVGCGSPVTLVGEVEGADSVVGISIGEERALMYLCGGPTDMERHHHWIDLTTTADGWEGTTDDIEVVLTGNEDGVVGEITEGGKVVLPVSASPGRSGDGPWQANVSLSGCQAGVVVKDGGTAMQGVHFCAEGPNFAQVVPIGVFEPRTGQIEVGLLGDADTQFTVVPAEPGA